MACLFYAYNKKSKLTCATIKVLVYSPSNEWGTIKR